MYIYYVYAYINKKTGLPYYIGKGKGNRAYVKHPGISVPSDKSKIIILEKNLSNIGALALERRYIRWYGRKDNDTGILLNKTDGGECPPSRKNAIISEKTRQKQREAKIGFTPWNKGISYSQKKPRSEEGCRNISISKTGERNPMYGKQLTEKHRQNISEGMKRAQEIKKARESNYYLSP